MDRVETMIGRALAAVLLALAVLPARADVPPMPKSPEEAVALERDDALPRTKFYDTPPLGASAPGDLLRREVFAGYAVPAGAQAIRILYHSVSADGRDVATSGVVLVPPGTPPAGGWPVIAWAHGTTGVARQCAPSLQKDMAYGEEGLMPMVRAGYAVVATDYHGLGTAGPHQYVDKIAQARDVVYSIPAAREAVPALGRKWVVDGHSQGGLAAWGVAELESDLHDPDYLGAVSVAGAADLHALLVQMSRPGGASFYLVYMAYAIHARSPEFKPSDMLTGKALERYAAASAKGCWNYTYASFLDDTDGSPLKPGWDALPAAQRFFHEDVLGSAPVDRPLLVIAGEADQTVPFDQVKEAVARACRHGVRLRFRSYPGLDHDPTMEQSTPDQLAWIRDRFDGKPDPGTCGS